ncbi:MAG TPA: Hpt domain-containing protein [Sphingomonas sp.]|nr:Hpt domain-containing protein [Sphingomonas sp.]
MAEFEARMAGLRERFAARTRGEAELVAAYARSGDRNALRDLCHAIAGTAGMFGFSTLGEAAGAVEDAIDEKAADDVLAHGVAHLLAQVERLPQGR